MSAQQPSKLALSRYAGHILRRLRDEGKTFDAIVSDVGISKTQVHSLVEGTGRGFGSKAEQALATLAHGGSIDAFRAAALAHAAEEPASPGPAAPDLAMTELQRFREAVKQHAAANRITQRVLADSAGVSQGAIWHFLSGRGGLTVTNAARLAKALGLPLDTGLDAPEDRTMHRIADALERIAAALEAMPKV